MRENSDRKFFLNRYFEGYTQIPVLNKKGRVRLKQVYTSQYIHRNLPDYKNILLFCLYGFLITIFMLLYFTAVLMNIPDNSVWYVGIFEGLSFMLLIVLLVLFVIYILAPSNMTIGKYKEISMGLKRVCKGLSVMQFGSAMAVLTYIFLHLKNLVPAELVCMTLFVVCGFLMYFVGAIENKIQYIDIPNKNASLKQKSDVEEPESNTK